MGVVSSVPPSDTWAGVGDDCDEVGVVVGIVCTMVGRGGWAFPDPINWQADSSPTPVKVSKSLICIFSPFLDNFVVVNKMLNIHCSRWIDKSIDFSPPMAWICPGRATSVQNALDHYIF
jgi:hypothetical protein